MFFRAMFYVVASSREPSPTGESIQVVDGSLCAKRNSEEQAMRGFNPFRAGVQTVGILLS
jgi:hypothetical protein